MSDRAYLVLFVASSLVCCSRNEQAIFPQRLEGVYVSNLASDDAIVVKPDHTWMRANRSRSDPAEQGTWSQEEIAPGHPLMVFQGLNSLVPAHMNDASKSRGTLVVMSVKMVDGQPAMWVRPERTLYFRRQPKVETPANP
jgi:hypothetical protein